MGRRIEIAGGTGRFIDLTAFECVILDHFDRTTPDGMVLPIGTISNVLRVRGYTPSFLTVRLERMVWHSLIQKGPPWDDPGAWHGMLTYGPIPGRKDHRKSEFEPLGAKLARQKR